MDLNKLKELVEAATPGPWIHEPENGVCDRAGHMVAKPYSTPSVDGRSLYERYNAQGEFIAAANPATVLSMIAEIERLNAQVTKLEAELKRVDWRAHE